MMDLSPGLAGLPVDQRIKVAVVGVQRGTSEKANGSLIDYIQFTEEIFTGQGVLCRVGKRCFGTVQETSSCSDLVEQ